ncbi:PqqD family peptide modification chaperone [Clostridium botulinum]|nr:PqqD family peptide modification chaperone [Clostridium botulinum]
MKFDKMSSEVWLSIDGEKSILDIAKIMSDKYGDKLEDSIYRLVTYIRYVSKRGWIAFKNKIFIIFIEVYI